MISKKGVKVLDFGLAKLSDADGTLTQTGAVMGTIAYMAPEQMEGKTADARTDIFALGLVLYEMATGKRVVPGQPPTLEGLPDRFAHVVEGAWQRTRPLAIRQRRRAELGWLQGCQPPAVVVVRS
jgi:serine/threonine protein kinase